MPKVLISDKMSPLAQEVFERRGVDVDVITELSPEELKEKIADYDGLALRSSTKVTADILSDAKNLKVIGRAGIGTDNIDKEAATGLGVVVMNTPFGNSITTAEHALSMMMALARQIPQANESTHQGKWEKKKFMGVELYGKTLGVIGCGNIGSIVIGRAKGLQMKVVGFDPFLTEQRAEEMGIEKVDLETLYARSDFITIHTPLNDKTRGLVGKASFDQMKEGVRIVNCARGGIIVESDLKRALDDGRVAGAALDVFEEEPAKQNILFNHPNVICTPHLGAATAEAQENVALQVAEQISDYLLDGVISNALNMPSISAEDAPKLKPYLNLSYQLGSFAGQITETAIKKIVIEFQGKAAHLNTKPLTAMIVAEILKPVLSGVNMVSAPILAKDHGIEIAETHVESTRSSHNAIKVAVSSEARERDVTGTLFAGVEPRIVNIEGVAIEATLSSNMLFTRNTDKPGFIGALGTALGAANYNIADFRLGRKGDGSALALISIDRAVDDQNLQSIEGLEQIIQVTRLKFND